MALMKRKRIGLNDAMSVVTRFVNACNRHDADGVAACLHPNFDSIQPMYPSRNFRGADQVRRNWQAIFDAEPGFRLTVLRSAAMDDTVWLELHGAGRDAEVAGIFIMGIVGDRIRWARIYSALVEPVAPGVATDPAASLQDVPRPDESPATGSGEVVAEDLIAPVVDIERSSRRRRRRRGSADDEGEGVEAQPAAEAATVVDVPEAPPSRESEVADEAAAEAESGVQDDGEPVFEVAGAPAADVVVDEDSGPPTEAVEMVALTDPDPDPDPGPEGEAEVQANDSVPQGAVEEPVAVVEPAPQSPRRRFGKRGRD